MPETAAIEGLETTLKSLEEKKLEVESREGGSAQDELKMLEEAREGALTKADVEADVEKGVAEQKFSRERVIKALEIPGTSPAPIKTQTPPMPLLPGDVMQRGG